MKKIDVIQFLPYFPPHKGGLETHAEEWALWWTKKGYGSVINVTGDLGQEYINNNLEWIEVDNIKIGYKRDGYITLITPSVDIIHNFPFPKFWTLQYRLVMQYLSTQKSDIVIGRTRFFLSALHAGYWAKKSGKKWVHIEHGSDFVMLDNKVKNLISYLYDQSIGRIIFAFCDMIVCVSEGSRTFLKEKFDVKKNISVIYRGINFIPFERQKKKEDTITIGFIGRLVKLKGVDILLSAFLKISKKLPNIELQIIGDGNQKKSLEKLTQELKIQTKVTFYGERAPSEIAQEFLPNIDILVNPSYQEGLPTSVVEGLLSGCAVVATDVGGTREISKEADLMLIPPNDMESLSAALEESIKTYSHIRGKSLPLLKKKFNWNNNIKTYQKLFVALIQGERKNNLKKD